MKDRSDDPSHHERTLLPRSYLSFLVLMMSWILVMVSYVVTLTGLLRLGSSSRLSLPRLNSASYFFTMLYEGAFSPSVTTMSAWISLGRKEGNVLFNYALFYYLRLYGVRHMVKDHSDSEKGNPLPPYRLLFPINSNVSFICIIPQIG